jgi:hypothetical protein
MAREFDMFVTGSNDPNVHVPMAQHNVNFTVPKRPLGKADIVFEIDADGERLGTLKISQGAVVWFPRLSRSGRKLSWKRFDELMQETGRRAERR